MRYLVPLLVLFFASPAFADDAAALAALVVPLLNSLGVPGMIVTGLLALFAGVRASAATLSKHQPDAKLGKAAKSINWLAGNTKHATNAALACVALSFVFALGCSAKQQVKFQDGSAKACAFVRAQQTLIEAGVQVVPNPEAVFSLGLTYDSAVSYCDRFDEYMKTFEAPEVTE